jgi:hypothetical protein
MPTLHDRRGRGKPRFIRTHGGKLVRVTEAQFAEYLRLSVDSLPNIIVTAEDDHILIETVEVQR